MNERKEKELVSPSVWQQLLPYLDDARKSLAGWSAQDEAILYLLNKEGAELPSALQTEVKQARLKEDALEAFSPRDWRSYFMQWLVGHGLEIGPLHRPLPKHQRMTVDYVDRLNAAQLRAHYPELAALALLEPTIIADAQNFAGIPDASYDFIIAAHVIEHLRNPIGALRAWCRVLKPGGKIYLIAPDKRMSFDRDRVRTNLEHLILDDKEPSFARDFEHFISYARYVHEKEGEQAIAEAKRLWEADYSIHYHVFQPSDLKELVFWFSSSVQALSILAGPSMSPGSDEFHLLLKRA